MIWNLLQYTQIKGAHLIKSLHSQGVQLYVKHS